MSLESMIKMMARGAKDASRQLRKIERARKDVALELMAQKLMKRKDTVKKENEKDR